MPRAADLVASAFALAYRNAGGSNDPQSFLKVGRPPYPDMKPQPAGTIRGAMTFRALHPDEGRGNHELSDNELRYGTQKLPKSDLRLIAISAASLARSEKRRNAIGTSENPLWSMTAHPLIAAAVSLYGLDIVPIYDSTPLLHDDGAEPVQLERFKDDHTISRMTMVAGHLWCNHFEEKQTGIKISQRMGRNLVRLEIPGINFPETVIASMKGAPLSDLLLHPLIDLVPHLPIHRLINRDGMKKDPNGNYLKPRITVEVIARPEPLALAPRDRDISWMRLPTLHYADIDHIDI